MKKYLIFVGILFMSLIVYGCNGDVDSSSSVDTSSIVESSSEVTLERVLSGVVTSDGEPVEGATVRIRNTSYTTTTDAEGKYSITISEEDAEMVEFRVIASKDGYTQNTLDVLEGSFVDGKYTLDITLESSTVVITGVVSSSEGVLQNAVVVIKNTSYETTTDENGRYSFTIDRPLEVELEVSCEFHKTTSIVLNNFESGSKFTQDFVLESNLTDISGKVSHFYLGAIEGVEVTIRGTDYTATTKADGTFTIENALLESEDYIVDLVKDGFVDASYKASEVNDEMEMMLDYVSLGKFAETAGDFEGFVTKSSEGFYFKFISPKPFRYENGKEEKVQLYIDVNETTSSRDGDTLIEFAMTSNNGVIVVVNYETQPITFLTSILWGEEVVYIHDYEDGITTLSLFIKYSIFNDYAGPNAAIDANSIVGLAVGQFSFFEDVPEPWNPLKREDMLGVDGHPHVEAANPQDYIRLAPDNTIYEATDNKVYVREARTINGVVSDSLGTISNVTVSIPRFNLSVLTDENGAYTLTIPEKYFGISKFDLVYQLTGYDTAYVTVNREDFVDAVATKDVTLEEGTEYASVTGNVVALGGNEGFTVRIKDTEITTITDENGEFSLSEIDTDLLPYTLVIEKDGYETKEIEIDTYNKVLEDVNVSRAYQKIGTMGHDKFDVYVKRTNDSFFFKYVTTSTFRDDLGEELIHQFLTFNDTVVDIRFVRNGWTGVWDLNANNWRLWTPQVHNPIIKVEDGVTTIEQQIEYAFFEGLTAETEVFFACEEESVYYHEGDVVDSYTLTKEDVSVGGDYYSKTKEVSFVGLTLIDGSEVSVPNPETHVKLV